MSNHIEIEPDINDLDFDDIVNRMSREDLQYLAKKYLILIKGFKKEKVLDLSQEAIICGNLQG